MKKTKLTLLFMTLLGLGAINAQTICAPGFNFFGYCYDNNLTNEVAFEVCPNAGETATATIVVGEFESSFDDLTIYEGASGSGTTGNIVFGPADGDVSGNTIDASAVDLCLIFVVNSDGSVSCQSSATIDPLEVCGGSIACMPSITCPAGSNEVPCADFTLDLGVAFNYVDISGTGAFVVAGDDVTGTQPLDAPWTLYGITSTALNVNTNGWLSNAPAGESGADFSNDCPINPNWSSGDDSGDRLLVYHDDLDANTISDPDAGVYYQYFNSSPVPHPSGVDYAAHIFQWVIDHFPDSGPTDMDFQAVLFANGDVIYQYNDVVSAVSPNGASATVGASTGSLSNSPCAPSTTQWFCNSAGAVQNGDAIGLSPYGGPLSQSPPPAQGLEADNDPGECFATLTLDVETSGCPGETVTYELTGATTGSGVFTGQALQFNVGTTLATFTVTDPSGASASCAFDVIVSDTEGPEFTGCNDVIVDLGPGECSAQVSWNVQALDNCEEFLSTGFLGTTFADGNGQAGNMFDVTNISSEQLTISGFDVHIDDFGTATLQLYRTTNPESFLGNETNGIAGATNENWTYIGQMTVNGNGFGNPTPLPLGGFVMNPGETYGIYIIQTDGTDIDYTNGVTDQDEFSDDYIRFNGGIGYAFPQFGGTIFTPRTWNGNIYYTFAEPLQSTVLEQTGGPMSGGQFEGGTTTTIEYTATDIYGNVSICSFDVIINPYSGPVNTSLACNDNVQVSLNDECQLVLGADVILEGGPYMCYDEYIVNVDEYGTTDVNGVPITISTGLHNVTVTDPNTGNSCWGTILVEDKIIPPLECEDIAVPCGADITPGNPTPFETVINASVDLENIVFGTAVACPGGDYSYLRVVDLEALGINSDITPTTFRMGVESSGGGVDATLRVYRFTNPNGYTPGQMGFTYAELTQIGGDVNGVIPALNLEFWEMPVTGITIPAGTKWLVWELAVPGGNFVDFVMGSNTAGETTPTYIASDFCGLPEPQTLASQGFPGNWVSMLISSYDAPFPFPLPDDVTITPPSGTGPFVVTGFDACGPAVLTFEDVESGTCDDVAVERTWTITDGSGNTSTCIQNISIEPLELSAVECPANYTGECGESTSPANTGYPTVNGVEIVNSFCNLFVGYYDVELTDCGGGIKISRHWDVLDWCTQETFTCVQVIKLSDNEGPVLDCPDDITVNADPWFCTADVNLEPPSAYDACGTSFSLSVSSSAGVIVPFGNYYRVDDLPLGTHTITWTAVDACDNESSCSYDITVEDNTPPVPLCDEHTIVALTSDDPLQEGLTKIPATVFDDGSYDNCSGVTFTARRMTSCINFDWIGPAPLYGEYPNSDGIVTSLDRGQTHQLLVPFACCDVGAGPIMVELRVTDAEGNVNTCMVEVEVQDKLSPFLEQPPDIIVSCDFWFDVAETNGFVDPSEDVTTPIFGDVLDAYEFEPSDRQPIILNDPGNDEYPQPYQWGYDGWADDNCDVEITVRVRLFDDCSGDGLPGAPPSPYTTRLVERTWRARDASNNSTTRVQRIWVVDFDPFYISDQTCVNADPNDGVIWPCDETYTTCPDEIPVNYPTVFDDNCSLIGVTYDDTRFDFVDGACYKILREWTIIDWCQYDVNTGAGLWSHIQVIKVLDHDAADFTDCPAGPVTLCVENDNVYLPNNNQVFLGEGNPNSSSCSAHVNMSRTVYETCSDYVIYDVKLYPNAGSEYIQVVSKTEVDLDSNNNATLTFSSEFATLPSNHPIRRYGVPYNSPVCSNWPLPGGEKDYHRILWTVEDGCGNISTCEYLFRLEDCKKPSPVCVGLSSVVMPSSGEVTIWAADFNASSFDDCTPAADLLYSFSGDTYEPSRSFDCAAIEANGSPSFIVEIWVADGGNDQDCDGFRQPLGIEWSERNKDYCTTFIVIDDNEDVCGNGGSGTAGGVIETEELEPVELVTVTLTNSQGEVMNTYTTTEDGIYHFVNPLLDYDITADRNDDHKNGVSTLDLVKIQKHLLGLESLGSPYKLIAADANNSESVSAIDLVEIRKLILGLYTEYPNNASWRFVDSEHTFADESNPWPFDEVIDPIQLSMGNDFVGVKVGDVNGTVAANAQSIETRNAVGVLELSTADQQVLAGQTVEVPVTSANFDGILGYQFTLRTEGLTLENVEGGALDMEAGNVGVHTSAITTSWNKAKAVTAGTDEVLFTLTFTATQNGQLSEMLSVGSRLTEAEAYNGSEEILDVALTFNNGVVPSTSKDFALFQNEPNPFNGETVVSFTLPEAMEATLTVFDVTGKVVHSVEGDYAAGHNEVKLSQKNLSATGVLYYRLDADDFTATKKMVVID